MAQIRGSSRLATLIHDPAGHFKIISVLSFCRCISAALIGIGIPIFVLTHWSLAEGSNFYSGLTGAVVAISYVSSTLIFGRASDKHGRKNTLIVSLMANVIVALLDFSLIFLVRIARTPLLLGFIVLNRGIEGFMNGLFWPVLAAGITDVGRFYCKSEAETTVTTKKGLGWYNVGWNAGLLAGSLLFYVLMIQDDLDLVIALPVIIQVINLLLMLFYKDVKPIRDETQEKQRKKDRSSDKAKKNQFQKRNFRAFFPILLGYLFVFIYGFSLNWIYMTTTNLLQFLGVASILGILEALRIMFQGITSSRTFIGKKHVELKILLLYLALCGLVAIAGFSTTPSGYWNFWYITPLVGTVMGLIYFEALNMAANSSAGKNHEGTVMGLFEGIGSTGSFLGAFFAGYFTQVSTFRESYFIGLYTFIVLIIAGGLLYVASRTKKPTA
jgi:MFS family permease